MSSEMAQQVLTDKIKLNSVVKLTNYAVNQLGASGRYAVPTCAAD